MPGLMIHWEGPQDSPCSHNQQREEALCVKVLKNPGFSFQKYSLPVESHRMYLIPLATGCDNTCAVLSAREAHLETQLVT